MSKKKRNALKKITSICVSKLKDSRSNLIIINSRSRSPTKKPSTTVGRSRKKKKYSTIQKNISIRVTVVRRKDKREHKRRDKRLPEDDLVRHSMLMMLLLHFLKHKNHHSCSMFRVSREREPILALLDFFEACYFAFSFKAFFIVRRSIIYLLYRLFQFSRF